MSREGCTPSRCEYWAVSKAASNLTNQACTLGARHINDGTLRIQFNREVSYYARGIVKDVAQGKTSPEQGLMYLKKEQSSLLSQSMEIAKKGVGAIAGGMQIAAGAGICYASVGVACLFPGLPLMAHGANNAYENGRNLWEERSDTAGPLRAVYHEGAKILGGGEFEGDMAYGAADLGLSAYGVGRLVLKPDAWRLFRYVRSDYARGYEEASRAALFIEVFADGMTLEGMYRQAAKRNE